MNQLFKLKINSYVYLLLWAQERPTAQILTVSSGLHIRIQLFQITLSGSKLKDKTERQYG